MMGWHAKVPIAMKTAYKLWIARASYKSNPYADYMITFSLPEQRHSRSLTILLITAGTPMDWKICIFYVGTVKVSCKLCVW